MRSAFRPRSIFLAPSPAPVTGELSFDVDFPIFGISFVAIRAEFVIDFPVFDVDFSMVSGGIASLDVNFPLFDVAFSMQVGESFNLEFPVFEVAFTHALGTQTASFDIEFPTFDIEFMLQAVQKLAAASDYEVWLINRKTGAHSTYANWQVNSYGKFNGNEIVLLPDGIYTLGAAKDGLSNINVSVRWQPSDLGTVKQKIVEMLSINMRNLSQEDIDVVAIVDELEARYFTKTIASCPEGLRRFRQPFPRGLEGQTWQFGLDNKNGGELLLDEIEAVIHDMTRRFR